MMERVAVVAVVAIVVWGAFAVGKSVALRRSRRAIAGNGWSGADLGGGDVSLVLFTGPRCSRCAAQRSAIETARSNRTGVGFVEFDASVETDLARRLIVMSVPTTVVVDATGEVLFRNGRLVDSAILGRQIDKALARR
jgi:hypothetical protein